MSDEFQRDAPGCDVLLAGFPCQPFSISGKGQGMRDSQGRGIVILKILQYIRKHLPGLVVLENVKGLVFRHREVVDMIVRELESLGYYVSWRLMETHLYSGLPHRRPRIYIVGLKTGEAWPARGGPAHFSVVWPRPIPCTELSSLLDPVSVVADYNKNPLTTKTSRRNLQKALGLVKIKAKREERHPSDYCVVADLGGSNVLMGWKVSVPATDVFVGSSRF